MLQNQQLISRMDLLQSELENQVASYGMSWMSTGLLVVPIIGIAVLIFQNRKNGGRGGGDYYPGYKGV